MTKKERIKYIKNLPNEVVEQIAEMYEDTSIRVKDIISEFSLPFSVGGLSGVLPPAIEEQTCKYCGVNLTRERNRTYPQDFACPICGHEEPNPRKESYGYRRFNCRCGNCRNVKRAEKELSLIKKKENIMLFAKKSVESVPYSELTYLQKVFLGSMITWSVNEANNVIESGKDNPNILSPIKSYDRTIVEELLALGIIKIKPDLDIDAFSDDGMEIVRPEILSYDLNVDFRPDELDDLTAGRLNGTYEEEVSLWQRMVALEGLGYLKDRMDFVGWIFQPGEKTYSLFLEMASKYSLGQIIYLVYISMKKTALDVIKKPTTPKHIYNKMINRIDHNYRSSMANKWNVPHYSRPKRIEISAMSKYVYTKVLNIAGFAEEVEANIHNLCLLRDANEGTVMDEGEINDYQ